MSHLITDPFLQFQNWYGAAKKRGFWRRVVTWLYPPALIYQPDSMTLATATLDGKPSARIVLYKGIRNQGIVFYTHYKSRKGVELTQNPHAALVFHWAFPQRQVRIEGTVSMLSRDESCKYWDSRPRGSQLSAVVSQQSEVIENYKMFVEKVKQLEVQLWGKSISCPPCWGGYVLVPNRWEFWEFRYNRMHERVCFELKNGKWEKYWLSP